MLLKIIKFFAVLLFFLLSLWGVIALYYNALPRPFNLLLAGGFAVASLYCYWSAFRQKKRKTLLVWAALFAVIVAHWLMLTPSQERDWRADMERPAYAEIDGDSVTLSNYRNFQYRSRDDFTPRYEERTVQLSHLTSVDFFISYWQPGPVGHTFLSFNFDNAPPVCISIEARYEEHEGFNPLASLFKQFELIYIVGSEQDIVGVRTNYRNEEVFMYPLEISPEAARDLFMVYLRRINQLAEHPEFYHLLSNSCTINIVRYANKIGRQGRWDFRLILNGYADRYLYDYEYIDASQTFAETRARAYITRLAQELGISPEFPERIRGQ